jgi:uncharacterized protein YyaL (SSP411 family)
MSNRLAGESSPYLKQHADNPVSWFPWGDEAFAEARKQDKPILLSVGYAACHWCHVMAHESFEDPATAAMMNESFINIKVDREERPDVDSIYMNAVVALTGQGGWPMTVILTPDGEPFFGGTYFPPAPRYGMPSFQQVLLSVSQAWADRRDEIIESAGQITQQLASTIRPASAGASLEASLLDDAVEALGRTFDARWGGFGGAPKFPQAMTIEFLLRQAVRTGEAAALKMAERTLEMMARGGMYDQLGGGFARYSTDQKWLVPHFEKMLYDNALLSLVYLHAWRMAGRPLYRRVVEETLDWALVEMRHELGGFFSSLDADSEGVEGKFYVWQADEIARILGDDGPLFDRFYGVTQRGNWEGQNILNVAATIEEVAAEFNVTPEVARERLGRARQALYAARARRSWPGLDDKILTAWNGLMVRALAEAGRDLHRADYLDAARATAGFIHDRLRREDGRLFRSWKEGHGARFSAYLEDYAFLAEGLLALYQSSFETRWYDWAFELGQIIMTHFQDREQGGFYDTADDHETMILRPKDIQDNAIPSGGASAANALLLLALYSGDGTFWDAARDAVAANSEFLARYPSGFAHWLCAADVIQGRPQEVAIIGDVTDDGTRQLLDAVFEHYRPNIVVAVGAGDSGIPLLSGRTQLDGRATAYVCRNFVCKLPVSDPVKLRELLP